MVKNGKTKAGKQRYRCLECGSSQSRSELRRIKAAFWWCYMHTKNTSRACRDAREHA